LSLKQAAGRLIVAVLTFATGLMLSSLSWPPPDEPSRAEQSAPSICELLQNPDLNGHEMIRVRGMLYGNVDGTLVLNELDCSGESAWMVLSFEPALIEQDEARRFIDRMRQQSVGETMARAEVLVVGRLTARTALRDAAPGYVIQVAAIESLTPISLVSFVAN
jgi:hypothetical protein